MYARASETGRLNRLAHTEGCEPLKRVKVADRDLLEESAVLDRDAEARARGPAEETPVPVAAL
jgi:hypothetical protein